MSFPTIKQFYSSGTSWYRIWSDNWCEQGGISATWKDTSYTITLLKNFSNTNYNVQFTPQGTNARGYAITVSAKTVSNFTIIQGQATNTGVSTSSNSSASCWYAYGYIA